MIERLYNLSFAELSDRMCIINMKVVYAENEDMKKAFVQERESIIHDLNLFIQEGVVMDAEMANYIANLQMINTEIWENESGGRGDGQKKNYELSHGLNSNRAEVKKIIQQKANGRIDHKLNYNRGIWDLRL